MRFSKGDWTHEKFMDVFFEVIKVQYTDEKRAKLRGFWWNLGWCGNPYKPFHTPETLTIQAKDFDQWKRLESRVRTVPESA